MKNIAPTLASLLLTLVHAPQALAQASCSSDGTPKPVALFERFISADCAACWGDAATPAPSTNSSAVVLDWIVPGTAGDDAPLSAAASTDALPRLQALGRKPPTSTDVHITSVDGAASGRLRVAHGVAFNDYVGTGISFTPSPAPMQRQEAAAPLAFHLLLVETIPAGTDGTVVPRHIVRSQFEGSWPQAQRSERDKGRPRVWMETRPMRIPDGAQAERLHLVGWVQDASGRIVAAAQSVCR
ncbi:hypothetical protein [Acidovorax sp. Root70]|uniref:hypothetical protein n=1 Tax=Acidovorax sp. Root70 TaxID=1736590 RepID=UPI0006F5C17B|nr:hypothetical protein [Acidovorax sp. Root70]KRB27494.1 hypothetical protein ASD94_11015 [Acidovorax sp. Root70]